MRKYFVLYFCFLWLSLHQFCVAIDTVPLVDDPPKDPVEISEIDDHISEENNVIEEKEIDTVVQPSQKDPLSEEIAPKPDEPEPVENEGENDEDSDREKTIRINEVLPNPDGTDAGNEFIEFFNYGEQSMSLNNWRLYDKTEKYYVFDDITLEPGAHLVLYNRTDFSFALNNSNEEIFLEDENKNIIAKFSYESSTSGRSWNYSEDDWYQESPTPNEKNSENPLTREYPHILINEIFPNPKENEKQNEFIELYNPTDEDISLTNWILRDASKTGKYIIDDTVILAKNYTLFYRSEFSFALNNSGDETISLIAPNGKTISSVSYTSSREERSLNYAKKWYWEKPTPGAENRDNPLIKTYPKLLLSEILPNPSGTESTDEYIEIYNPNDMPVDLENWVLRDATVSGAYTFMDKLYIAPHAYFVIYRDTFSFALNNSNETVYLIAPNEKVVDVLTYDKSKEDVSYNYERITKKWRRSKHLTPGRENIFNNLPEIIKYDIDKNSYKNVYTHFNAEARDVDGEKLKVRWDFGDGRKSYKWKTRHKYTDTGTYHGSLRIQDGSEEVIKNFTVTIKKYPKHKISITKIVPNPSGKDLGSEHIILKNNSDEKIDLKNWSIATGTKEKTLTNHPVYDNLSIKPGKTKVIKRKHAAISLPNKHGVIEIRRPDGSVSDQRKYGDENTMIPDNASYEKIDGLWQWIIPIDQEAQKEIDMIIARALQNEKIFSQQRLEQKIAYNLIHASHKENISRDTENTELLPFENIFVYLNQLVNKMALFFHNTTKKISQKTLDEHITIHTIIKNNEDPCENLYIPTKKQYSFCNQNIAKTSEKWDDRQ
jgi:hypothetical protein